MHYHNFEKILGSGNREWKYKEMKNKVFKTIAGAMVATIVLSGCDSSQISLEADEAATEVSKEDVSVEKDEAATEESVEDASTKDASVEENTDDATLDESSDDEDSDESASLDNSELYEAFIDGSEKVYFNEEDDILPYRYQQNLNYGEGYTVDELIEGSLASCYKYDDSKGDPTFESKYIDCGNDGIKELVVEVRFPGLENDEYEESEEYLDEWVIKDIDGKLVAKYYGYTAHYWYTSINEYGYVSVNTVGAYLGVLTEQFGFLDENADWVLYYNYYYYLDMDDYVREKGNKGLILDCSSDDWNEMQVEEYVFDEKAPYTDSEKTGFMTYYKYDNDGIIDDDSIYEDSSIYKQTFDEAGVNTCPRSEVEERLEKRREEIGLSEEIM